MCISRNLTLLIAIFSVSLGKGSYWFINESKVVSPVGTKNCRLVVVYLIFVFHVCLPQKLTVFSLCSQPIFCDSIVERKWIHNNVFARLREITFFPFCAIIYKGRISGMLNELA